MCRKESFFLSPILAVEEGVVVLSTLGTLYEIPITVNGFVVLGKALEAMPKLTQHIELTVDLSIQKYIAAVKTMKALSTTVVT